MTNVLWLIGFIIGIWAVIKILKSKTSTGKKILWILIVWLLSYVGLIIWWFVGPKK
jgi:hypothetical protein